MKYSLIPFDHIDDVWEKVRPMLEPAVAVSSGRYTTYDVYNGVQQQRMQLWAAFDEGVIYGCQVTTIVEYPSKRALCLLFTAGRNLRAWRDVAAAYQMRWARDNQCDLIEGMGRIGWQKMLEPYGAQKTLLMFEKEL